MNRPEGVLALTSAIDEVRVVVGRSLHASRRAELGQFMTPAPIARFMASMFHLPARDLHILDAGAGVGSLTAALVEALTSRRSRPKSIAATVFEIDPLLVVHLRGTLRACKAAATAHDISFSSRVRDEDFIRVASSSLDGGLFGGKTRPQFNAAILNPPYRKLNSHSRERVMLRVAGIETSNLYTAFVGLAIKLLEPGGELVAITPRSFCNGPYFRRFRELLLRETSLLRVHLFETRDCAFADDDVLQENVIFHAKKGAPRRSVVLTSSTGPDEPGSSRTVSHDAIVDPMDSNLLIHLAVSTADENIARRMRGLTSNLADLGITVSTGRVVDFRAREHLRAEPAPRTVPLIYPVHFAEGFVSWPRNGGRKPNALSVNAATREFMVPSETYTLTKRFSSKEEKRRVVAAVYDPSRLPREVSDVAFENHLNYFHARGRGLSKWTARGLALFLNSTLVDQFFRQFNGHTQVNASDLRSLRYPTIGQLNSMGRRLGRSFGDQARIDAIVDEALSQTRKASAR